MAQIQMSAAVHVVPPVAIVTGGSTGIGHEICLQLLARGYEVVSLAREASPIDHPKLSSVVADLMDARATGVVAQAICAERAVTTIVHNAGVIRAALLPDVKSDDLQALTQLHMGTAIQLVQAALPTMRARGHGRIVLISSRAALGLPTRTVYSATKAGMLGLARTWALELGSMGITANVVAPGPIRTPMFFDVVPEGSEQEAKLAASIPVRRLGEPEDVARAVCFLVDPASGFITGQTLYVCGGTSIGSLPS